MIADPSKGDTEFAAGDRVHVLFAAHLPREVIQTTTTVDRVDRREGRETLYWLAGVPCARTARVLRAVDHA